MQIDVKEGRYWFQEHKEKKFIFSAESPLGEGETSNFVAFFSVEAPFTSALFPSLTTMEDSNLFQKAIQESHLESRGNSSY